MASSFGSDGFRLFAMFAAIFRSPFEKTIIDPAITLSFVPEVHEYMLMYKLVIVLTTSAPALDMTFFMQ